MRWQNVQVLGEAWRICRASSFCGRAKSRCPRSTSSACSTTKPRLACHVRLITALRAEGFALDEGFAVAHLTRSPKRYRQGSGLIEAERAPHHGCVQLHHPILLKTADEVRQVAQAWRKIHAHAALFAKSERKK